MNQFLVRYGNALFIVVALGSVAGLALIDTPFNAPFHWAFRYLSGPIAFAILAYTFLNRHELIALTGSRRKVYSTAVLLMPILILFSGTYVSLLNALCGHGAGVVHAGAIQRKFETYGRSHGWHIQIYDEAIGVPLTFNVSPGVYASYNVGDRYSRSMRNGCLGIPYECRTR